MTHILKKLGTQAPIYMAGVIASRLAGFLMLPIYTSYLTTSDYGVLELLMLTVEVIGTIGAIGLSAGVLKFYAEYDKEIEKREVLTTATMGILGLTLLVATLGGLFAGQLNELVLGEDGRAIYFRLFFAIYFMQQAELIPMLLFRIQDRPIAFVSVGVAKLVAQLSMNIWLVVFLDMGVLGVLIGNLIATAVFSLGLTVHFFRTVGIAFSKPKFVRMVRFGFPMMFWFLGNFVMVFSDRYFLNYYAGADQVGIYSLGYRFVILISTLAFEPFMNAWDPQRFELAKRDDSEETFTKVFTYLNLALGIAALFIAMFVQDVVRIMAQKPEFHSAYTVVPILLMAQIIYHWVAFANLGLLLKERTDILGKLAMLTAGVVLVLNLLLVPRFGIMGAASATLGAYIFRFLAVLAVSQKLYFIRYDWTRIGALYLIIVSAIGARFAFASLPVFASIPYGALLAVVALGAVYRLVLGDAERTFARAGVPKVRSMVAARFGRS